METVYDIREIMKFLPHRYPFLLVDRVLEVVPNEKITTLKNVTMNEPFFQGHFPHMPVMPGVLIVEGMAQSGAPDRFGAQTPSDTAGPAAGATGPQSGVTASCH